MKMFRIGRLVSLLVTFFVSSCSSAGDGSIRFFASGEEAAEVGYPVGVGADAIAFADGWTLSFTHVMVGLGEVTLDDAAIAGDTMLVDLHLGREELFVEAGLSPQRYGIGYQLVAPGAATADVGPVDAALRARMMAAGASLLIEGSATHPVHGTYSFEFILPRGVTAHACEQSDGTLGVVVPENGVAEGEITIHLDHLFFDSATAEEPNLRFDAWAAVAGDDRHITMDELATQDLSDLLGVGGGPLVDGEGNVVGYEPPATGLPAMNLRAFVEAQAITVAHWNGEGHCEYR